MTKESEAVVVLDEVSKSFGKTEAVKNLSARFASGKLTGLIGPDGAGKTTLMRLMAGLMSPTSGGITVLGFNTVNESKDLADDVGYMPQQFGLYEDLSVGENLNLYADLRGIVGKQKEKVFAELLQLTRLEPFTARLSGKLSGGMKQKLGLACALMARPKLLLLDEPSVGVDPVSRHDLWEMVAALLRDGMAVVWATTYLDEAERCNFVVLLNQGELLYNGRPTKLTERLEGRSYLLGGVYRNRRKILAELMEQPFVSDGVIQGGSIRVVEREGKMDGTLADFAVHCGGTVQQVRPRFEDAFIDLLGGVEMRHSKISEKMEMVEGKDEVMIECSHLTKKFGDFTATEDVSFTVGKGEIFGLLGPNGAGKSTTFKMLCGLLSITSGSATVVGHKLEQAPRQVKMKIGYMAQKFSLYGLLSVKQNLEFSAGVYGLAGKKKRERIEDMVTTFNLSPFLDFEPGKLSLGYRQRLALACAIMHNPVVLFLDEPTSGVDPITRREFWTHINGFVTKGMTVMITTHFMDEAEYCDTIGLMYASQLIALDSPDVLKERCRRENEDELTMEDAFIRLIQHAEKK